jgi:hypothetical protein
MLARAEITRDYMKKSGQLVSERSCAKLELKNLQRDLQIGPPTDFAELRLPKNRVPT